LHTHASGQGYFATDVRTITVPYPNPVAIGIPVACSSIAGRWSIHLTGTGDLTGTDADAELDFSQSATGTISGTLNAINPIQSCEAQPWSVV
jgi:hypothetical protein